MEISPEKYNSRQMWPCSDTFIKRFGSWLKAKELAHRPEWVEDLAA
jgi:hypothetical protein